MAQVSRWAELTGGIVLLAIGVNILREHGALTVF
jgi:putative Mn2+ efflux pump MntP